MHRPGSQHEDICEVSTYAEALAKEAEVYLRASVNLGVVDHFLIADEETQKNDVEWLVEEGREVRLLWATHHWQEYVDQGTSSSDYHCMW